MLNEYPTCPLTFPMITKTLTFLMVTMVALVKVQGKPVYLEKGAFFQDL